MPTRSRRADRERRPAQTRRLAVSPAMPVPCRHGRPRRIVPTFPPSASTNQQILAGLAEGTGGFTIFNTNDLLAGLERIGREQNEFYILGYVPPDSAEGTCHTLKVKLNRGGMNVRSRSGYCNTKTANVLERKPFEKQLESHATGSQAGSIHGVLQTPYFYTAPDTAREQAPRSAGATCPLRGFPCCGRRKPRRW